ncbi:MAG: AAA family ATPase, partial [Pseudomonadota bacterium]
ADQGPILSFLGDPQTYGLAANDDVRRIETHAAYVFLAGDRAVKLKKAVWRPYLDYSTLNQRRICCAREVALNQRTAPQVYLQATAVRRLEDGQLALGGDAGFILDWVVEMNRFPEDAMADTALEAGRIGVDEIYDLAAGVAVFHQDAEASPDMGGAETMNWVAQDNLERLYECIAAFPTERALNLLQNQLRALARFSPLMEVRRESGFTRRCHGDLHLGNVAMLDGAPTPFDAIEFDDRLACIDVLYDLAFLLMDLDRRGRGDLANVALNAYLEHCDALPEQLEAVGMLPLLMSMRATIRAHIEATLALEGDGQLPRAERLRLANGYLQRALVAMDQEDRPAVIAIGGLQGAGKSTVAAAIAPRIGGPPGAVVLRADALRKRLHGVRPTERLPQAAYSEVASDHVFGALAECAVTIARADRPVIVDGTFIDPKRRSRFEREALNAGVPFIGLWFEAPIDALEGRVDARSQAERPDVSDADVTVLRRSAERTVGELGVWRRIDAAGAPSAVADAALRAIEDALDRR